MLAYYVNSNGEKLNLLKAPYRMVNTDVFDSEWEEKDGGYEKTVDIDVFGRKEDFTKNMEELYRIIAVDSEKGVYGRLYVNDNYLICNVKKSKKGNWKGFVFSEVELVFEAPMLEWIHEERKSFYPQQEEVVDGLNFPFSFPLNFTPESYGQEQWNVEHVMPSDFQMIIYGPCVNPKILINGYPYEILATLENNEYLVINSMDSTVTKYMSNGNTVNLFNERGYEFSVFERIPSGLLTINWPGDFGFDLVLFRVRREPNW